ncbi:MAG: hypothetical protein LBT65_09200 [Synergistaceae bacterium]|jgi:hypothetical protein|nr:hypothetical protein [Synergistaceae bacterium]
MKRNRGLLWVLLIVFGFVVMAGGCGGGGGDGDGDSDSGGGWPGGSTPTPPVTGGYDFEDLEGTWVLVPGTATGTARGSGYGMSGTGTGTGKSGTLTVANIRPVSGGADADVTVESVWHIKVTIPGYGNYEEDMPVNLSSMDGDFDPEHAGEVLKKKNANTFVLEYTYNAGAGEGSGTITITLASPTTANVVHTDTSSGDGLNLELNMKYSLKKQ